MRERQKLRLICNHLGGAQKQFLYTTWFTKPNRPVKQAITNPSHPKAS